VDWTKLLFQIINLAVMGLILYRLLFKSVLRALDERSKRVMSALDDVERREREAAEMYAQYQQKMIQIKETIASMRQEAKEEFWRTRKHILAEMRREIEAMRAKAEREIEETLQRKVYEYQCQLGHLVTTLSGHLVRKAGGDSFQRACMGQFMERLSRMNYTRMLPADEYRADELHPLNRVDGERVVPVRLFSAYALDDASVARLEKQAQKMVGRPAKVNCQVDPALVAGATMSIGDMMMDGSVAGVLRRLYERYIADLEPSPRKDGES
jgi:F-type H+-transporting ATPase subunit b